jgi:hypothetical protein
MSSKGSFKSVVEPILNILARNAEKFIYFINRKVQQKRKKNIYKYIYIRLKDEIISFNSRVLFSRSFDFLFLKQKSQH